MKKVTLLMGLIMAISSCSTVTTIAPKNNSVNMGRLGHNSYCNEIPRIYSGVSYVGCLLFSEQGTNKHTRSDASDVPMAIIDGVFSVVADTAVLPYTIYRQSEDGNIKVE